MINGQRVVKNRGEEEMNAAGSCVNSRSGRENWEDVFSRGAATEVFFFLMTSFVCAQRCFVESASVFLTAMFCHPRFIFWSQSST